MTAKEEVKVLKVPFWRPPVTDDIRQAAIDALDNERFILGESVHRFEEAFAAHVGTQHAVTISSGTHALQLTYEALGLAGGTGLTAPTSFIATAHAMVTAGGRPAFADVDGATGNLDPDAVAAALRGDTRVVVPVHLTGRPTDMDPILEAAAARDVPVVEDACQAHGATYKGRNVGTLGTAACFSFYTTKNLFVGGDGGMVTTDDDALAEAVRSLRDGGRAPGEQNVHVRVGTTARLNTIQCAIGLAALKHLPAWTTRRRELAERYRRLLEEVADGSGGRLRLPPEDASGTTSVYHLFAVNAADRRERDALQAHLEERGVATGIHYPTPIHQQPSLRGLAIVPEGGLPAAEAYADTTLTLPLHALLREEEQDHVAACVTDFYGGGA